MAAGTSADELAGKYRRLAALVEELEDDGYDVVDAEPMEDQHGRQHAAVQLNLDGGLDAEPFRASEQESDGQRQSVGCVVDHDNLDEGEECPDCDHVEPLPDPATTEEDQSPVGEREVAPDVEEDVVDAVEEATDDDQTEEPEVGNEVDDPVADEIVSILKAEDELHSSDLRDRVDGNRTEFYDAVDDLKAADQLTVRDDPDDGRRKLYSLAGDDDQADEPVWNGPVPEELVADSGLPARVVLDDILDAVAAAETVIEAAQTLEVDVDNLEPVCWQLTLKQPDSLEIVDDVGDQIETIREVADVE